VRELTQIADGWEIVSVQSNATTLFSALMRMVLKIPEAPPGAASTWTVRQTSTDTVRKVTAMSEQDAKSKIELGLFDEE
jgi:hypothetical protein